LSSLLIISVLVAIPLGLIWALVFLPALHLSGLDLLGAGARDQSRYVFRLWLCALFWALAPTFSDYFMGHHGPDDLLSMRQFWGPWSIAFGVTAFTIAGAAIGQTLRGIIPPLPRPILKLTLVGLLTGLLWWLPEMTLMNPVESGRYGRWILAFYVVAPGLPLYARALRQRLSRGRTGSGHSP